jgi:hypothetical protein
VPEDPKGSSLFIVDNSISGWTAVGTENLIRALSDRTCSGNAASSAVGEAACGCRNGIG